MKKLLSLGICAVLSLSFTPSLAQQNKGSDALPSIPAENPPAQGNINSGNVTEKDMRQMINPLHIIQEQEKKKQEVNKTNSWKSSLSDEELIARHKQEESEGKDSEKQQSKAEILKSLQEKETVSTETDDADKSETTEQEKEEQTSDKKLASDTDQEEDTKTAESKVVGNNADTQDNKPKPKEAEADQETIKKEVIIKYKTAIDNIQKPKKPMRTWSLD